MSDKQTKEKKNIKNVAREGVFAAAWDHLLGVFGEAGNEDHLLGVLGQAGASRPMSS